MKIKTSPQILMHSYLQLFFKVLHIISPYQTAVSKLGAYNEKK